ncbi:MAG: hypothetical protein ACKO4Z_00030 [Planctomycetota bacterium]
MVSHLDESPAGQREEKRNTSAAAGVLATATALGAASAMADIVTVTTTQQSGTAVPSSGSTASFDVLFTPIQDVTDLVSISAGSVYTGEGASLAIQAIASDDTTVTVFTDPLNPFFLNTSLSSVTNNTFTDFSAREIKGLRFTLTQFAPIPKPSLTIPTATDFQFVAVPEPVAGVMLACGLAAVLISRRFPRLWSTGRTS